MYVGVLYEKSSEVQVDDLKTFFIDQIKDELELNPAFFPLILFETQAKGDAGLMVDKSRGWFNIVPTFIQLP